MIMKKRKKKHLSEYMWIISALYLFLGLFNMLFAWLGLLCFLIPLMISLLGGGKHIAIPIVVEDSSSIY